MRISSRSRPVVRCDSSRGRHRRVWIFLRRACWAGGPKSFPDYCLHTVIHSVLLEMRSHRSQHAVCLFGFRSLAGDRQQTIELQRFSPPDAPSETRKVGLTHLRQRLRMFVFTKGDHMASASSATRILPSLSSCSALEEERRLPSFLAELKGRSTIRPGLWSLEPR